MSHKWKWSYLLLLTLAIPACQQEVPAKEFTFDLADWNKIEIPHADRELKVRIDVNSTGGPINSYVYLVVDGVEVRDALRDKTPTDKILDRKENFQSATLHATIPPKAAYMLYFTLASSTPAKVTVRVTN